MSAQGVQLAFNTQGIEPMSFNGGGELWQDGWNKVIIVDSDGKATNANDGSGMLVLTIKCTEGPNVNKTLIIRLNIWHKTSAQAVELATRELTSIMLACGKPVLQASTAELHNIPFYVLTQQQERTYQVNNQTRTTKQSEVVGYRDINGNEIGKSAAGANAPAAAPAGAPGPGAPAATPAPGNFAPPTGAPAAAPAAPGTGWQPQGGAPAAPAQAPNGFAPPQGQPGPGWGPPAGGGAPAPAGWTPPGQ